MLWPSDRIAELDRRNGFHYVAGVIRSFKGRDAAELFEGRFVRRLPGDIQIRAHRKLRLIDAAATLDFLRVPSSNRLEALKGDRTGQHSIRINERWRVCFVWRDGDAYSVEIVDYH